MANRTNLWERHQNKRAQAKKERAKKRHFHKETEKLFDWEATNQEVEGAHIGIIAGTERNLFTVMEHDMYFACTLGPAVHPRLSQQLVVGDRVYYDKTEENIGYILGRQERKSVIIRMRGDSTRYSSAALEQHVIAANVEHAVIVAAAKNPEFHPRFIDRYLIILQNGDVEPIICINKCDLTTERHPILTFYRESGIPIVETSVVTNEGIELLKNTIQGKISVLVGHSGVGKSSLVNAIISHANVRVSEVSQKTGKGRHTTSASNLYKWGENSYIIDTPGIRSLGIENVEKCSIRYFFTEFEKFAEHCKYRDCMHDHEPNCAVKAAVEAGEINAYRYESYLRMVRE